ncbi:MAG: glycine--tRNA ligase [Candidatus Kerfeldbacteria bacterium]|nr:glycine--tRNA ligase [Candidatus Kerfeldbacteria bacterium]
MVDIDTVISLAKQRGFIYPGSEIYGGLANAWDYGPLGAQLRFNIKRLWWQQVVEQRPDIVGLDGAILMNPKVWQASGHVDTFHDPMKECQACHRRYRANDLDTSNCPNCGGSLSAPRDFNLMFKTWIGPVADSTTPVYLRPETAQAMFVNFRNVLNTTRQRLPFGIAQIGKAFRNEITPGNYIFRTLEFEQMEIEYFVEPANWVEQFEQWAQWMEQWAQQLGLDIAALHRYEVPADERAHYSQRTIDFEFDFPFGRKELWGLAYRGDFDLRNHQIQSGEKLEYTDPMDPTKKFLPHIIEPTMGVDRTMLALLLSAYHTETVNGETRVVLRFTPQLAPYQVAVLPLARKPELAALTEPLYQQLSKRWRCDFDTTQSIGKRYRRQDEIGTPYCITIDFDSVIDHAVTIRQRDAMTQVRVPLNQVDQYVHDQITPTS